MTDKEIDSKFDELKDQLTGITDKLAIRERADKELLEMYTNIKGFLKVMSWVEYCSVWVAKMSVAMGILWLIFKESVKEAFRREGGG